VSVKLLGTVASGAATEQAQRPLEATGEGQPRAADRGRGSNRMLSYVAPDESSDGGISHGGEKRVRVQPGETVRIEMPSPDQDPVHKDPRAPRMAKDLAGHTLALIVTAKSI
jgi:hypothetical protein